MDSSLCLERVAFQDPDSKLRSVWSQHPNFRLVSHEESFLKKITTGFTILVDMVRELFRKPEE